MRDIFYAGFLRFEFFEDALTKKLVRVITGTDNCKQKVHDEREYTHEECMLFNLGALEFKAEVLNDAHHACIDLFNRSKLGYTPEFCGGEA